jgi:hypothetical protein
MQWMDRYNESEGAFGLLFVFRVLAFPFRQFVSLVSLLLVFLFMYLFCLFVCFFFVYFSFLSDSQVTIASAEKEDELSGMCMANQIITVDTYKINVEPCASPFPSRSLALMGYFG